MKLLVCLVVVFYVMYLEFVEAVNGQGSVGSSQPSAGCPEQCRSTDSRVNCEDLNLNRILSINSGCRSRARELDFSNNQIKEIPQDFFEGFDALNVLVLKKNKIQSLPTRVFRDLGQLNELYLQFNNLSRLQPGVFEGLEQLDDRLILRCNRLTQVTTGVFGSLVSVKILSVNENWIETIEAESFNGMRELEYLHLQDNHILRIDSGTFSGLGQLKRLFLQENHINVIEFGAFDGLKKLTELKLSSNRITKVSSIVGLPSLMNLDIADNRIKTLDNNQFLLEKLLGNLKISIGENPLQCTCQVEMLRIWYRQNRESSDGAMCVTPREYASVQLKDIHEPLPACRPVKNATVSKLGTGTSEDEPKSSLLTITLIPVIGLLVLSICIYLAIKKYTASRQSMELQQEDPKPAQPDGYTPDAYHTFLSHEDDHTDTAPNFSPPPPPEINGHVFRTEDETSEILQYSSGYLSPDEINGTSSQDKYNRTPITPNIISLPSRVITSTRHPRRPRVNYSCP